MSERKNFLDPVWRQMKHLFSKLKQTLDTAFPDTGKRNAMLVFVGLLVAGLAYLVAMLDIGIWIGDLSISGMIAGYWIDPKKSYPWWLLLLLIVLVAVISYFGIAKTNGNTGRGFSLSGDQTYGSAREINDEELNEVAEIKNKWEATNTILGQIDQTENRLITAKPNPNFNGNIVVLGPPGSGKSFCFVVPTILQAIRRNESMICTDTKGELWAETAEFARKHGYIVRRVDLIDPDHSDGWDLLKELRRNDSRVLTMTRSIMDNTEPQKDIHAAAEASLLKAILLYVERHPALPDDERNIYTAYSMLLDPEGPAALDRKFADAAFIPEMRSAYEAYASYIQGSPNLRGNIINGLANRLNILSTPSIKAMLTTDDIDLASLGKQPTILYLHCSDLEESMKFVSSMFISFAFLDLVSLADSNMGRKLEVPVTFLMEEFSNLGVIPNITNYLSTCRSRGINIMLAIQSLAQLQEKYGDKQADIILSDCATHLCIGYNDRTTAEYFEWRAGEASIDVRTDRHTYGEGPIHFGRQYTTGEGRRNLYTSHELMTIPAGQVYLVWQRKNGKLAYTFGMNRHPAVLTGETQTISTQIKVRLSDRVAKNYIREQEENRVRAYRQWVEQGGNPWSKYNGSAPAGNGPMRNAPPPEVIPYSDLEDAALQYQKEKRTKKKKQTQWEISHQTPAPPPPEVEDFSDPVYEKSDCSVPERPDPPAAPTPEPVQSSAKRQDASPAPLWRQAPQTGRFDPRDELNDIVNGTVLDASAKPDSGIRPIQEHSPDDKSSQDRQQEHTEPQENIESGFWDSIGGTPNPEANRNQQKRTSPLNEAAQSLPGRQRRNR